MSDPLRVALPDGSVVDYKDMIEPAFAEFFRRCAPHTLTAQSGAQVPYAMFKAVEYVAKNRIAGDIVECGVWSGGSCLLAALSLIHFGDRTRRIYMYDTFAGMPEPSEVDLDWDGNPAWRAWKNHRDAGKRWGDGGSVAFVRSIVESSGYPSQLIVAVEGMVEDTIPANCPGTIAILRLDTDLYDSTLHELEHLYPRLARGGVLIVDDYGYFRGARAAVDQYVEMTGAKLLLSRIDASARMAVKVD